MSDAPVGRRLINLSLVVVYLGFGVALPLIFIIGNHAKASAQVGGVKLTAAEKQGRALFGEHCAVCHTLVAAAAVGKVGPNLDILKPSEQLILHTLANGCLRIPEPRRTPPASATGTCPPISCRAATRKRSPRSSRRSPGTEFLIPAAAGPDPARLPSSAQPQ